MGLEKIFDPEFIGTVVAFPIVTFAALYTSHKTLPIVGGFIKKHLDNYVATLPPSDFTKKIRTSEHVGNLFGYNETKAYDLNDDWCKPSETLYFKMRKGNNCSPWPNPNKGMIGNYMTEKGLFKNPDNGVSETIYAKDGVFNVITICKRE